MGNQFRDEWVQWMVGGASKPSIRFRLAASILFSILLHWWVILLKEVFHYNKGKLAGEMPIVGYGISLLIWFGAFFLWSANRRFPNWEVIRWIIVYVVAMELLIMVIAVIGIGEP